jgi:pyruvate/2-oxoglutarate dehydrogenase complex dihydrolipoamide dehydrogenase (E3) component
MLLPQDEYNETLVRNVHPPGWVNPTPEPRYNLVVIGAGTAGLVTAAGAAGLGAKVALVERHLMGGDCLNVGCVPSKAIIASSRAVAEARRAEDFGLRLAQGIDADFPEVMRRMRRIRAHISHHDSAKRFHEELGVDLFLGDARFIDGNSVEVGGTRLRFKKAVIATGARPFEPPIPGLSEAGFSTNETIFNLTELPRRLAVIGGGPIGCELAQAFSRLGSAVTIVEMGPQFLMREDPDAAGILARKFEEEWIEVLLGATTEKVTVLGGEKILVVRQAGAEREIVADEILVGAGREPNVEGLNLEAVGVECDPVKGVAVDDNLRTTNRRIFAAGDVAMRYKFTHAADAAARIVIQNALFCGRKKLSAVVMPWSTYTDPEIAHVGMYERDAAERGIEVDTFTRHFSEVDRAIADGDEEGFVKVHVKKGSDRILGATIVARHAGEMISELTLALPHAGRGY